MKRPRIAILIMVGSDSNRGSGWTRDTFETVQAEHMLAPAAACCNRHEENPVETLSAVIASLSCGLALSGSVVAGASEGNGQQVETTRTPADHEAIAKAREDKAARLDARVKIHTDMVRLYMLGELEDTPGAISMREHCDRLVKSYGDAAAAARQMAAEHRALAHAH